MKIFLADITAINLSAKKEEFIAMLDESELQRYRNFSSSHTSLQFLVGRALAKTVLAKILQCNLSEISLQADANGRLEIASPKCDLSFNLSHSKNLVALAVSKLCAGIDVECFKKRNFVEIAKEFFTKSQFEQLLQALPLEQTKLFYEFWTRKEAFIKCNGQQLFRHDEEVSDLYEFITLPIADEVFLSAVLKHQDQGFVGLQQVEVNYFLQQKKLSFVMDQAGKWRQQI